MNAELHADPSLGHQQKGSSAMKKESSSHRMREMRIERHHDKAGNVTGHTVHHHMEPKKVGKSGAFMEHHTESYPFGAGDHAGMMKHVAEHLKAAAPMAEEAAHEEMG